MVCVSLTLIEARARAEQLSSISYDIELDLTAGADDGEEGFGCRTAIRLDDLTWSAVAEGVSGIGDPLVRSVLWGSIFDLVRTGELAADAFLALVTRHLPSESEVAVV